MLSPLHIFKPGTFTATQGTTLTFSEQDLQATAQSYDPARHEAPLVVGHPELNAPAYGWVKTLRFADGELRAEPDQVDPAFAEMVNAGRFKKISAAFFTPQSPNNPTPGVYSLRHVGFLGAAAPAVKGLRTPTFSDPATETDLVTIEFSSPEIPPENPMSHDPLAAEKAALAQREAALAQKEADFQTQRLQEQRSRTVAFAEQLAQQGRLLPCDQPGVVELLTGVSESPSVHFAEAGQTLPQTPRQWLERFLQRLPVQVDFSERTAAQDVPPATVAFAAPPGYQVDASQLALHHKAQALSRTRNIPYLQALSEVA